MSSLCSGFTFMVFVFPFAYRVCHLLCGDCNEISAERGRQSQPVLDYHQSLCKSVRKTQLKILLWEIHVTPHLVIYLPCDYRDLAYFGLRNAFPMPLWNCLCHERIVLVNCWLMQGCCESPSVHAWHHKRSRSVVPVIFANSVRATTWYFTAQLRTTENVDAWGDVGEREFISHHD